MIVPGMRGFRSAGAGGTLRDEGAVHACCIAADRPVAPHFPVDEPLPGALVRKLLEVRMAEAFDKG
jgi:hypothetical protein